MPQLLISFKNSKTSKIVFLLSIFASAIWCLGQVINVYRVVLAGVIFELLWLPMLGMIFVLPILSLIFWVKEKFKVRSLYLYSILILVTIILLMLFRK